MPQSTPETANMKHILIVGFLFFLAACSNIPGDPGFAGHPLDCAMGFRHADCNPGTLGYNNSVAVTNSDDATCQSYGLQFGTSAYAQCRQNIDSQRGANARAAAALLASQNRPPPPPQPYYVPTNPTVNCTSNRIGNTVNTNCN
jgi:hypothetical protein